MRQSPVPVERTETLFICTGTSLALVRKAVTPKDWPGTAVVKVSCASTAKAGAAMIGVGAGDTTAVRVTPSASTMALLNCASFTESSCRTLYFASAERSEAVTFCISNCVCFKPAASSGTSFAGCEGE